MLVRKPMSSSRCTVILMILLSWILLDALAKGIIIFLNNQELFMGQLHDFMEAIEYYF